MLDKKDLDSIEKMFDRKFLEVENKLNKNIDTKFEAFETKMNNSIDAKFEAFEAKMNNSIDAKFEAFEVKMDNKIDAKFEAFEVKMDNKIDNKFKEFKNQFSLELSDVLNDIIATIDVKFNKMEEKMNQRFALQDSKIDLLLEYSRDNLRKHDEYDRHFSRINSKLLNHDLRLSSLESRSTTAI